MAASKRKAPIRKAQDELMLPEFLRRTKPTTPKKVAVVKPKPKVLADANDPVQYEGLAYHRVYYARGGGPDGGRRYYVTNDPPCSGWAHAFLISPMQSRSKGKRFTLFDIGSLSSYSVMDDAAEIGPAEAMTKGRAADLARRIVEKWKYYCAIGERRDYDVAALVLTRLGVEVPSDVPAISEEAREKKETEKKGKDAGEELLKAVNRASKRGKVAEFFLGGPRSIREAMATLDSTRSGILTHLFGLNKDHGLGYTIVADTAEVLLPPGVADPFAAPPVKEGAKPVVKPVKEGKPSGKPLLDVTSPPKPGSKRAQVAEEMVGGFAKIAKVAKDVGCSEASVRSHLHDLHTKNGFGFELSSDKASARVLAPKGWSALS